MTGNAPTPSGVTPEFQTLKNSLAIVFLLQVVLMAGLVILYIQIGAIPDQTSQLVPEDTSSSQVLFDLDPIGTNITDLQAQVSSMAAKVDAMCIVLEKDNPTAIAPNACSAP